MFRFKSALASMVLGVALATSASAITLTFDETSMSSNSQATGASGVADLAFTDTIAGDVRVTATITNTTDVTTFGAGATKSKLTGFGFDLLDGVTLIIGSFVAGDHLDTILTDVAFPPFGSLNLGLADNNNFIGGNANSALPEGDQDVIVFDLSVGSYGNAAGLEAAFLTEFYDGNLKAGMRFQQVNAGAGSDKLLWGEPTLTTMPIPASGLLLIAGLGAMGALRRRNRAA